MNLGVKVLMALYVSSQLQLEPSDTLFIEEELGKLTIIEITKEEDGKYACVARNILGVDIEVSFATVVGESTSETFFSSRRPAVDTGAIRCS